MKRIVLLESFMMKTQLRVAFTSAVLVAIFLGISFSGAIAQNANQPKTAKIKKKDGQVVEGKIRGMIAQKITEEKTVEGKTTYYGNYVITAGANITAIDEGGVQAQVPLAYFSAGGDQALDDVEIVNSAMRSFTGNDLVFGITGKVSLLASGRGLAILFKDPDSLKEMPSWPLIGEVRNEEGKYRIVSAIEVETDKGLATMPLSEIVEFKSKSEKLTPEKKSGARSPAVEDMSSLRYKAISNARHQLQIKKVIRGRNFGGVQTRDDSDVFLTVYVDTQDPCFDWHGDQKCFDPPLNGLDKLQKACGFVKDVSGKKYDADGGGTWEEGTFCNYIVPKTLGSVTLSLHGYPEIALSKE